MKHRISQLYAAVALALGQAAFISAAQAVAIHSVNDFGAHVQNLGDYDVVEIKDQLSNNRYEVNLDNTLQRGLQLYIACDLGTDNSSPLTNNHLVWSSGNIGSSQKQVDVFLYAAFSDSADLTNNSLVIQSGEFYPVTDRGVTYGRLVAAGTHDGNMRNNSVLITGGKFMSNIEVIAARSDLESDRFQVAQNNTVTIKGGQFLGYEDFDEQQLGNIGEVAASVFGASIELGNANSNTVQIEGISRSEFSQITGAFVDSGSATKNKVELINVKPIAVATLLGAQSISDTEECLTSENRILIKDSFIHFGTIAAAENYAGDITNNNITIENSTLRPIEFFAGEDAYLGNTSYISGGVAENPDSTYSIKGNVIKLVDSTIDVPDWAEVYVVGGGSAWTSSDVTDNTIILQSAGDAFNENNYAKVNFMGAQTYGRSSGNSLILDRWRGSVGSLATFDNIEFRNFQWANGETLLKVNHQASIENTQLTVDAGSIRFDGALEDHFGEKMTLIEGAGDALSFNPAYDNGQTIAIPSSLTEDSTGVIQNNPEENSVEFRLEGTVPSRQLELVSNNRNMGLFFVNHGAELILDNLDATSRDYHWGLRTFASIDGVQSNYSTKGHIDVHGFTAAAGLANSVMAGGNPLLLNLFVETGKGDYSEEMSYLNIDRRFSGEMKYYGAGLSARIKNPAGWYLEGSLRAGRMESDVKRGLIDSNGQGHGYELSGSYFGAHVGLGKIFEIGDDRKLDLFAKYFYTYLPDDSEDIAADGVNNRFDFDSVSSSRIRAGGRIYFPLQKSLWAYTGLAYQYDFTPDVRVEVNGQKIADGASMRGSMGIGSLGLRYKSDESPWVMDLKIRGYVGQREGVSGKAQVEYRF